jgi:flagellar basal body rod protein FlgG
MKQNIVLFILLVFSYVVFADDNNLLNEYKLLYNDLSNIDTVSYKSYFNKEYNKASESINITQGALLLTEVPTDFAIAGEGYFKIRLENNIIGWTRFGALLIDSNGDIRTNQGFYLYDNINLQENFFPQSLRITNNGNVYISIYEERNDIIEIYAGQILIYNIQIELLSRYSDTIFVINEDAKYNEELSDSKIVQGALEMSNVHILPVILRMYYILNVIKENYITNIELKKELLKIQIEKSAGNYLLEEILLSINYNIVNTYDLLESINSFNIEDKEEVLDPTVTIPERLLKTFNQKHITNRFNKELFNIKRFEYLMSILPYLRYDY